MPFDELIFGKIANYLKKNKRLTDAVADRTVNLEEIRPRLIILARALTGKPIDIFAAEREGGFKGNNYFLPATYSVYPQKDQNLSFYFFRVMYISVQQKLRLNWYNTENLSNELAKEKAAASSGEILQVLDQEYPIAAELHHFFAAQIEKTTSPQQLPDYSWLYGKWMTDQDGDAQTSPLVNFSDCISSAAYRPEITTIKAKAADEVKTAVIDKKQQEDYVLTHNFEKVETADEFSGSWRDFDGDDDMEDHADALQDLNLKHTVRTDDTAHSVYQADFIENASVKETADSATTGYYISYPEWNYTKQQYRKDFCRLFPVTQLEENAPYYVRTINEYKSTLLGLRKMLTHINNKSQQTRRQTQGDEFETDAVTDLFTDVHSGHTPSEKIYLSNRNKEKDLSILLLLDISLSSDSYAAGNRVIDVEKQVSILFGEILNDFSIDFAITCFNSKTRNHSSYLTLKNFGEDWSRAKNKIGAVQPGGYTRIGPAIRHSGVLLGQRPAKNKWLILISDGKPNDFDKYEGRYGVQDVKQALRELNDRRINSYALAIEKQAKYYLPQMFGQNHYQILTTPVNLLQSLVKLFEKIRHQ